MKKILIILGLITFSSYIFCMQENNSNETQIKQLTMWQKAKAGGALTGAILFSWATLLNFDTRTKKQSDLSEFYWYHYPTLGSIFPTALIAGLIERYSDYKIANAPLYNLVLGYTSLAALGLGYYAHKKLTKSKIEKKLELKNLLKRDN